MKAWVDEKNWAAVAEDQSENGSYTCTFGEGPIGLKLFSIQKERQIVIVVVNVDAHGQGMANGVQDGSVVLAIGGVRCDGAGLSLLTLKKHLKSRPLDIRFARPSSRSKLLAAQSKLEDVTHDTTALPVMQANQGGQMRDTRALPPKRGDARAMPPKQKTPPLTPTDGTRSGDGTETTTQSPGKSAISMVKPAPLRPKAPIQSNHAHIPANGASVGTASTFDRFEKSEAQLRATVQRGAMKDVKAASTAPTADMDGVKVKSKPRNENGDEKENVCCFPWARKKEEEPQRHHDPTTRAAQKQSVKEEEPQRRHDPTTRAAQKQSAKEEEPQRRRDPATSAAHRLSVKLIDTYKLINTRYYAKKQRRSTAVDYDVQIGGTIMDIKSNKGYVIKRRLGRGSFGQVVEACDQESGQYVAIKIIKSHPGFTAQAQREIAILTVLKKHDPDPNGESKTVRLLSTFMFQDHQCLVFELLSATLYQLLTNTSFRGISLGLTRKFALQLLKSLAFLSGLPRPVIHCDLKPENIVLCHPRRAAVKVIDFGSSCFFDGRTHSYVQSRYYRAPEVMMGIEYGCAIDMWSLACILMEMYTGSALFNGGSTHSHMQKVVEMLGLPPQKMVKDSPSKQRDSLFTNTGGCYSFKGCSATHRTPAHWQCRVPLETAQKELAKLCIQKCDAGSTELASFIDLVSRMLVFDPAQRITPDQALAHEFAAAEFDADQAPAVEAKMAAGLVLNGRVEAQYKGKGGWFKGKLRAVNADGTHDVVFDDRSADVAVRPESIRATGGGRAERRRRLRWAAQAEAQAAAAADSLQLLLVAQVCLQ
jgi:dual specificity tyrosine-phosphorylation-regulated kinase 1